MLGIEILESRKNVMLGSGVLRSLQNEHTPKLDLLVRESIQNSLDAAVESNLIKDVSIEFNIGEFESKTLTDQLSKVGPNINKIYKGKQEFISIRDTGTMGLTGPISHNNVSNQNFGNFVKLVYDISKPQEQEGAGGSWGIGKTIYYRMGIGIVIYYTKIKSGHNKYEERLAIAMVEDETRKDALIPPYQGTTKGGVAWWGTSVGENETEPITDVNIIDKILKNFKIPRYSTAQTGTTIIIPYIDSQEILKNNEIVANNEKGSSEILGDLALALEYSIQRWYSPRLNNDLYHFGKKKNLKVTINNKHLTENNQHPYFRLIKDMYNYSLSGKQSAISFFKDKDKLVREEITLGTTAGNKLSSSVVGYLTYGIFDYNELGLGREFDPVNPHFLSNISDTTDENNTPIVTFCRQPGMLISYQDKGEWANRLPSVATDKYIVSIFVLNSNNDLLITDLDTTYKLEEYIRQSEASDHIEWHDHNKFGVNPKIISRIQNRINAIIKKEFEEKVKELPTNNDSRLSKYAGKMILPPMGYGKKASKLQKVNRGKSTITRTSLGVSSSLNLSDITYTKTGIQVPITFTVRSNGRFTLGATLSVKGDSSKMDLHKYESELGMDAPFSINYLHLEDKNNSIYSSNSENAREYFYIDINLNKTTKSIQMTKDFSVGEVLSGYIDIDIKSKNYVPNIQLTTKESK